MIYRVVISHAASDEIDRIVGWYAEQSLAVADAWYLEVLDTIHTLEEWPRRCPVARHFSVSGREVRQLLFGKRRGQYRVLFEIEGKTVHVLRVCHTAQEP